MTESDDKFTNKIISYGASLLLHAAVIGVFMSLSGGSPALESDEVEEDEEQPPAVRPLPKPAVDESEDGAQEMPAYHVVRQGETLTKIAALYNTTPQKLAKLNGKSLNAMNKLWVNQKVKLRK